MKETKAEIMAGVECVESKVVAPNTVKYRRENGDVVIRLHHTDIITRKPNGDIILNSGGWRTVTTKDRMNEYMGHGLSISQHKGVWTLHVPWQAHKAAGPYLYADGMVIHPDDVVGYNTGIMPLVFATARQRAEALVKTMEGS